MKKEIIRSGDVVKIINPEFFLRCGYPLSLKDGIKLIMEDEKDKECFENLCNRFGIIGRSLDSLDGIRLPRDYYKMLDILAYWKVRQKGFGGRERKIYTRRVEEAKGHEFEVRSKKMVVTGNYVHGREDREWESGHIEYEPPYLADMESHMILYLYDGCVDGDFFHVGNTLNPVRNDTWILMSNENCPLAIERCNIEVVKKKEVEVDSDTMLAVEKQLEEAQNSLTGCGRGNSL
jgi:hypothetical protein